ncbi:hypothetical protein NE865_10123 [Phthorimaea operculella]|nr:hypothetical protein NE865_10123 [Phthorimaea operculella]
MSTLAGLSPVPELFSRGMDSGDVTLVAETVLPALGDRDIKPEDAPQPMGSVFISPPTCLKPQQPGLKPPQPGLKPTKPVSKTPQTSFEAPQPALKPWGFSDNIEELDDDAPLTIRPPQHDLKQPVPAIKPPQPGLRPPEPGLKLPQSGSIAVQPGLIAKDKKHICRYCNRPFTYPKALENHIVESHSGSSSDTKCEICNKTMKDNSSLKRHMIYHEKKNVYCDICDKWYKNCQFQRHLKISPNHNKKEDLDASSLECSVCKKTFTCEMYLRRHMRYMHDQKNVHCSTCDKWFRPKSYKEHLKTSSNHAKGDEKRFTCDQCNMKFLRKSKMLLHITSKHLKLNLFKCVSCPREYGSKSALTRHVQRAHERRPVPKNHVCDVCGKAFQDSQLLRRHMPVHTGERAYQCEKCGAKFKHDGTLNVHKRKCLEKRRLEITDQQLVGHPQI